jgi:hypothetical protein
MHSGTADHEGIREVMQRYGDIMDRCGYSKVLEDIEGDGAIGRAVRRPDNVKALVAIERFLRDLANLLQAERPSQERANALAATAAAYHEVKRHVEVPPT